MARRTRASGPGRSGGGAGVLGAPVPGPVWSVRATSASATPSANSDRLPGSARGEALLDAEFARYREVRGKPPTRASTASGPLDGDPLDPDDYLRRLRRGPGLR